MTRIVIFIFGILAYAVGVAGLFYFLLFMGSWDFLPLHVDSKTASGPAAIAILVNLGLLTIWGLQHSVMARPTFKKAWKKIVPDAIERSIYILLSGVLMIVLCLFWKPLSGVVWDVENSVVRTILIVVHLLGWTIAVAATFMINHFELFGLQQVYHNLVKKTLETPEFTDRLLYKIVRHPMQLGMLVGFWSAPTMTSTHLMLTLGMSVYIFIGLYFEERNLVETLGKDYEDYQKRVRKILPIPKR
ncbi:MAG: protein-S-isoprenylcysteine O-methyltransferase Ste14 [Verrucomicrobiales bacterium]|jgi:protein-S-isoprenylcysteine O-methyltransferase Ste14